MTSYLDTVATGRRASAIVIFATALYLAVTPMAYAIAARPAGARFAPYFGYHAVLVALSIAVWWALRRAPRPSLVLGVVVVGVLARLVLVGAPSFTSTDVARYLWDGAVVVDGHDPYLLAPDSPSLATLAREFPAPIDHLDVPTCYPPLAIALFAMCAATGPTFAWLAWKALVALASIATLLLVWRHLRGGERAADVALLALAPIALLEGGVGGHLDALVALSVTAAIIAAGAGRMRTAALAIGCAAALKLVPGVLVLVLLRSATRRAEIVAWFALPLVLGVAASLSLGASPIGSLPLVAETWSFGSPLWAFATWLAPDHEGAIRLTLLATGIALVALIAWRRPLVAAAQEALAVSLVASPTLYPWYASALAPLVALRPTTWSIALLAVLPASYEVIDAYQARGDWSPARWPMVLVAMAPMVAPLLRSAFTLSVHAADVEARAT